MVVSVQQVKMLDVLELKLMEHYGHGDLMVLVNWDLIKDQVIIIHHQFK